MINVDGHPAYASAIAELKQSGELGRRCRCRTAPYLNNVIEQDHQFIKKRITASLEDSDRSRVLAERSKVTRRCMQSVKVRSAGWRKTTPSRNASSSTRSSASRHSSHRACEPPHLPPRYLQHNRWLRVLRQALLACAIARPPPHIRADFTGKASSTQALSVRSARLPGAA